MIPDYIDCNNEEVVVCDYFLTEACKDTCAYAKEIGLGIGGMKVIPGNLEKEVDGNG